MKQGFSAERLTSIGQSMSGTLVHRGPDDSGIWVDATAGLMLVHRRLSVVDLSSAGHQPIVSSNGRYVMVYNGEIYNTDSLRRDLVASGFHFKGRSDTEVLLEGIVAWGITGLLERIVGMFAFALWDTHSRTLTLARDRLGIKPLYWGKVGQQFVFASELKALRQLPDSAFEINRDALVGLLRYNYIPAPLSIYTGIEKLSPGSVVRIDSKGHIERFSFWDLRSIAERSNSRIMSDEEAEYEIEQLVSDSVRCRMTADVPLGTFLSGGIDSSLVTALMQEHSNKAIKTFTVGFTKAEYNEAQHAKAVAQYLGTEHTEEFIDVDIGKSVIPNLPKLFDEPFADISQIPTYLVSRMARQHVTVALSGDGGDEIFAGYTRYLWIKSYAKIVKACPNVAKKMSKHAIELLSPDSWSVVSRLIPRTLRPPQFGERLHKLAGILSCSDFDDIYRILISQWPDPVSGVINGKEFPGLTWDKNLKTIVPNALDRMQFTDQMTYLPDDILTKVDRASMAVSLEVRVPLLDHRLVELSWRLPESSKIRDRKGKWILRKLLSRHLPENLINRPKQGFAAPVGDWLRGSLREWAESLLSETRLRNEGYLQPAPIRAYWNEHLAGRMNRQHQLWGPLMFQAWLEHTKQSYG